MGLTRLVQSLGLVAIGTLAPNAQASHVGEVSSTNSCYVCVEPVLFNCPLDGPFYCASVCDYYGIDVNCSVGGACPSGYVKISCGPD
jgi:hypothetical protein